MIQNRGGREGRERYRGEEETREESGSRPKGRQDKRKHFRACLPRNSTVYLSIENGRVICSSAQNNVVIM